MKKQDELDKELEDLSPFLAKMKEKREGFEVPKDYFKTLPDEVLGKLQMDSKNGDAAWHEQIALFFQTLWQPRFALAIASAVTLIVVAVCFFKRNTTAEDPQPIASVHASEIPYEQLHEYLSENIEDVDEALIVEASLPASTADTKTTDLPQPTNEELEQYLDDVIDEIDPKDLEDLF